MASTPNQQTEHVSEARLEAVSGPTEGRIFSLEEGELSIGREPTNQISLLDPLVSRRHCVLRRDGPDVRLEDLDSRNSTFVNGVPVKERVLVHGDQVRVGNSIFVFHGPHDEATPSSSLRLDDSATPAGPTVILRKENAVYLQPSQPGASLPSSARTVRDLNVLLNFSRTLSSVHDVANLQQKVLDAVFEVAPADRAAVLLLEEGSEEFSSILGRYRTSGPEQPIQASQTILNQVMRENVAVLSNDVIEDETYRAADSLASPNVRSVLAAPMEAQGKLVGVIYLDASSAGVHFDAGLLQLVLALGNIAGLAMANVRHLEWLGGENRRLQQELSADHGMVGESQPMRAVLEFISRVAGRESTVLIWGESGTGKELVARAIHANSSRANKPFVAINCAAITETLLESELFGHEKGAFTGAVMQKRGKLETADGGTVFLDEVGELAVPLQAKLLRVLQEREFERVGGTRPIKVDIRVIAATNRDLKEASRAGTFRQDLYYRLNVVSVRMPALRERKEDIPLLANFFALRFGEKVKRRVAGISPKARACLLRYEWPGNVRELENAIERAVVLGSTELILVEDLPEALVEETATEGEPVTALHEGLREAKKALIERAIEQAGGNYTEAAGILGVHPNHLFRLIRTLDLKPKRQRQA
ncbi:MAG TPA: sigma 54-interacting transcriptional regulator [Terriglobales bacterium]|nr:sigma 54-interacting transcriptional regulator [Terriglobales bacterium]